MTDARSPGPRSGRLDHHGFTLVEVIVVLVLLGLAAALAAPAFLSREREPESQLATIVRGVRELAERRGEIVHLRVGASGDWQVEGAASPAAGTLAEGRLDDFAGPGFTLVVAPIGTCAFDVRSSGAARFIAIDPLTCEVQAHVQGTDR